MTTSLVFIAGALSLTLSMAAVASDAPVYVPLPPGDYVDAPPWPFDADGHRIKPQPRNAPPEADVIVPPRADPQHPNPGANEIYPPSSRRLGEQGTVTLLITVNDDGRVTEAKVQTSSGNGHLDEVAQKAAARSWHFIPGTINGRPSTMQMPIKVTFR